MKQGIAEEFKKLTMNEVYPDDIRIADWKERPNLILELIDSQLEDFGLEIISYNTRGDFYAWRIVKRESKMK